MDTLPFETLERIFHLACTDGGSTGNALSLVSKHVRAIARTTRFRSIALAASPRRLQAFVALYERECDPTRGDKPRIRHLHVTFPRIEDCGSPPLQARARSLSPPPRRLPQSTTRMQEASQQPSADFASSANASHYTTATSSAGPDVTVVPNLRNLGRRPLPIPPVQPPPQSLRDSADIPPAISAPRQTVLQDTRARRSTVAEHNPNPTASPEYIRAAQTLFRLATPDLVTLVVQCGFSFGGDLRLPVVDRPFPRLREATFVGVEYADRLLTDEAHALTATPLFPSMTHLSIAIAYAGCGTMLHSFWPSRAPRVTHLAVSRADHGLHDIAAAVGGRPNTGPPLAPRYPSVRCLLVQPSRGYIETWGETSSRTVIQTAFLWMLGQVGLDCEAIGVEVIVANALEHGEAGSYYARARRGWLERIEDDRDEVGSWGLTVILEDAVEGPLPTSCTVWRELFPWS